MPTNPLFEISNLVCSYNGSTKSSVLQIEKLNLNKGKMIFLLGASGSGKSTLLETLGFMNNTISSGKIKIYVKGKEHDLVSLWHENKARELAEIRKNFLSFIFQNTNLMENFTAYENICLSFMIKEQSNFGKAYPGAFDLMKKVGLSSNQVNNKTIAINLSGGQRQRVSFVRALNTNFEVLLCDEPTGNLDEVNAHELLEIVRRNINSEKSAIIVSHDVNLALKFADEILVISKNEKEGYGEILQENIYTSDYWKGLSANDFSLFRAKLVSFFGHPEESPTKNEAAIIEGDSEQTYKSLFLKKEGAMLFGKAKKNLAILTSIIAITFFALGFANGALEYIGKKLNDKFVNWLVVPLPSVKANSTVLNEFLQAINDSVVKNELLISSVSAFKRVSLPFFKNEREKYEFIPGRLLEYSDPLASDFFSKDNILWGAADFMDDRDLGIVVTPTFLSRLGYNSEEYPQFIYFNNSEYDTINGNKIHFKVPIPLRAVVKSIPGKNHCMVTPFFYSSWVNGGENSVFNFKNTQSKSIVLLINDSRSKVKSVCDEIEKNKSALNIEEVYIDSSTVVRQREKNAVLSRINPLMIPEEEEYEEIVLDTNRQNLGFDLLIDTNAFSQISGYVIKFSFDKLPFDFHNTENTFKKIQNFASYKSLGNKVTRIIDYDLAPDVKNDSPNDYLSINLIASDSIDAVSRFVTENFNTGREGQQSNVVEVDAGSIKEKNNFRYISKLTLLTSFMLIVFCLLSITLFISNLLRTHLEKIKMNIGTFKAFGLNDNHSTKIYLNIMLRFVIVALVIALVISLVLGFVISKFISSRFNIGEDIEYFVLWNWKTAALIFVLLSVSIYVSWFNINKILSKTPGDLIYNR